MYIDSGGTGYFPTRLLREHEAAGRLHRVPRAPEFGLPAYLCFAADTRSEPLALETIWRAAREAT
ncbi:MAG: hypothetical protein ACRETT_00610 [Steroidobacteraceae bacterium]